MSIKYDAYTRMEKILKRDKRINSGARHDLLGRANERLCSLPQAELERLLQGDDASLKSELLRIGGVASVEPAGRAIQLEGVHHDPCK
jgi:hypothetical protein